MKRRWGLFSLLISMSSGFCFAEQPVTEMEFYGWKYRVTTPLGYVMDDSYHGDSDIDLIFKRLNPESYISKGHHIYVEPKRRCGDLYATLDDFITKENSSLQNVNKNISIEHYRDCYRSNGELIRIYRMHDSVNKNYFLKAFLQLDDSFFVFGSASKSEDEREKTENSFIELINNTSYRK